MATYTYGARPGYEVRNRSGAVVLGITLEFYANHADAANRQNVLGTTTTDQQGQWSFLNAVGPIIWLRDPEGDAMSLEADDPDFATNTALNAVKATADQALANAGTGGGGGGGTVNVDLSNYYTKAEVGGVVGSASAGDRDRANHTGTQAPSTITGTAVITTDSRLSDTRTPKAHSHITSDVTGLDAALATKLDSTSLSAALRNTDCVIAYTTTQPLRNNPTNGTPDTLRRVRWVSPNAPATSAGYAINGLDVWEKTV